MSIKIAFRNIFRNKRRTLLTMLMVMMGGFCIVLFNGFVQNAKISMREDLINTKTGHIQIFKKGYDQAGKEESLNYLIEDSRQLNKELLRLPHVVSTSLELEFSGLLQYGKKSIMYVGRGVDPQKNKDIYIQDKIVRGKNLDGQTTPEGSVLGIGLAKKTKAEPGSYFTILTSTPDGAFNAVDAEVTGIFKSGIIEYDKIALKIPLEHAKRLCQTQDVTRIVILLDDTQNIDSAKRAMQALIDQNHFPLEVVSWDQLDVFYHQVVDILNAIFGFMRLIIILIIVFGIVNTLTMNVYERVNEIGTLRAIGVSRRKIGFEFFLEGIFIGMLGGIGGCILGSVVSLIIGALGGIPMPPPPGLSKNVQVFIVLMPEAFFMAIAISVAASGLASILPSRKAANMNIIDAIRFI